MFGEGAELLVDTIMRPPSCCRGWKTWQADGGTETEGDGDGIVLSCRVRALFLDVHSSDKVGANRRR